MKEQIPVRIDGTDLVVDLGWAKRGCRHCHGTGVMGVRVLAGGKKRERIICTCVGKEVMRRKQVLDADAAKRGAHGA